MLPVLLIFKTIAKVFQKLGSQKYNELTKAYNAMCTHPYLVAGKDRFDTEFMKAMNSKTVSKSGGEAIMSVLKSLNLLSLKEKQQIKAFISKPILNHNGIQTGKIEVV